MEWERPIGGMSRLPEKRYAEVVGDSLSLIIGELAGKESDPQESVDHYTTAGEGDDVKRSACEHHVRRDQVRYQGRSSP